MKSVAVFIFRVIANVFACWVVSVLWTWFVVPLGMPGLSWLRVLGIDLMVATFRGVWNADLIIGELAPKTEANRTVLSSAGTVFMAVLGLGGGALVHWVMVHWT